MTIRELTQCARVDTISVYIGDEEVLNFSECLNQYELQIYGDLKIKNFGVVDENGKSELVITLDTITKVIREP